MSAKLCYEQMNVQRNCCYVYYNLMPIKLTTFCSRSTAFAYLKFEYSFLIIASVLQLWSHRPARAKAPAGFCLIGLLQCDVPTYILARAWMFHATHSLCVHCWGQIKQISLLITNQRSSKSKNIQIKELLLMGLYPPANINPKMNTLSGGYNVCA